MIIAVDFDGTCVEHMHPHVGQNVPLAAETLRTLVNEGHRLIIWTMRDGPGLEDARNWYIKNGISFWGTQRNPEQDVWTKSPKAYANLYIDDAAYGCPLILPPGFTKFCVDWSKVLDYVRMLEEKRK